MTKNVPFSQANQAVPDAEARALEILNERLWHFTSVGMGNCRAAQRVRREIEQHQSRSGTGVSPVSFSNRTGAGARATIEHLTAGLAHLESVGLANSCAAQIVRGELNRQLLIQSASLLANADFDPNEPRNRGNGQWVKGNSGGPSTNSPPQPAAQGTPGRETDDDDTDNIPLTYGGAHAKLRQSQSDASAQLYNKGGGEMKAVAGVGRAAAEANPIVGFVDGTYQAVEGKDAIDPNKQLTPGQRWKSGGDALLAIAPFVLKGGKLIKVVGETEEAVNVGRGLAKGWSALVKSENFALAENQAVSGLIKDGKVFAIGDPGLGHADLAKKFGIELVNGKLPKGMEGFLAQKIGGKIGVIGAGINGTGTDWPISNGGKKVAEAFFK